MKEAPEPGTVLTQYGRRHATGFRIRPRVNVEAGVSLIAGRYRPEVARAMVVRRGIYRPGIDAVRSTSWPTPHRPCPSTSLSGTRANGTMTWPNASTPASGRCRRRMSDVRPDRDRAGPGAVVVDDRPAVVALSREGDGILASALVRDPGGHATLLHAAQEALRALSDEIDLKLTVLG